MEDPPIIDAFIVEEVGVQESDLQASCMLIGYRWSLKPPVDSPAPIPAQPVHLVSDPFKEKGAQQSVLRYSRDVV